MTRSSLFLSLCLLTTRATAQNNPPQDSQQEPPSTTTQATTPSTQSNTLSLDHRPRRPFVFEPIIDLPVMATTAALWVFPEMMQRELWTLGRCPCDPAMLNPIDRPVAGQRLPMPSWITDGWMAAMIVAPAALDILDVWRSNAPWHEWFEDTFVYGEALLVSGALTEMAKLIVQRPRPTAYGGDPEDGLLQDPFSYQSFYSLAGSISFTAALAGGMMFSYRHPNSPLRYAYFGAGISLATALSLSRVLTGRHFPTDILAGAAAGTLVGLLIPYLHARRTPVRLSAAPTVGGGAVITATLVTR